MPMSIRPERSKPTRHRRMAVAGALVLGAAATAAPVLMTGAAATAAVTSTTTSIVPTSNWDNPAWAAEWMTGKTTYTQETAVGVAEKYDVVAAMPRTFPAYVDAMHAANPDLVLLTYTLGPFANTKTTYAEEMYAHDASGQRVTARTFKTQLVNLYSQAWKDEQLRLCNDGVRTSGYDGCFIDSMGNAVLNDSYVTSKPIDPRTGAPYTKAQWMQDARDVAQYVRSRVDYPVVTNGLGSGRRYFTDHTEQLVHGSDVSMAEAWLRLPHASGDAWPTPSVWKQSVDMLVDSEAKGSGTLTVTKMWTDGGVAEHVAKQWYDYTLATFMLGTQGRSAMFFMKDGCTPFVCGAGAGDLATQPAPDLTLGAAEGGYAAVGNGAYTRSFVNGLVAVNPTTAPLTVTLPAGVVYTDQDGGTVSGSVTVRDHGGLVLTEASATPVVPETPEVLPETPAIPETPEVLPETPDVPETPEVLPESPEPPAGPSPSGYSCNGKAATIVGTKKGEVIRGTARDDVIVALDGNDTIYGGGGNDTVCAGAGADKVFGEAGNDYLLGGSLDDTLNGGDGNDNLQGAAGNDTLNGGAGDDLLAGGDGTDTGAGGSGKNTFRQVERLR
jgi:Hypothetical glycosyl hydrolase family 15/RTX calcium-binding nonapeptide repeat (4 copies)